jgi:hypothetical protein
VESNSELYKDVQSKIVVEDWVGPITATLEVWHVVNDIPELRQLPIVSPYHHFFRYSSLTSIACFARAISSTEPNNLHHRHRTRRQKSYFRRLRQIQDGRTRYGPVQEIAHQWNRSQGSQQAKTRQAQARLVKLGY